MDAPGRREQRAGRAVLAGPRLHRGLRSERALPADGAGGWADRLAQRLRSVLGVGAKVVAVPQNTFDRTEFKARRVIDDRHLLDRISGTEAGRAS